MDKGTRYIEITQARLTVEDRKILDISQSSIPLQGATALIGPNGCGKTTLLKFLSRLIRIPQASLHIPFDSQAVVFHNTPFIRTSVRNNIGLLKDRFPELTDHQIDSTLKQFHLFHLRNDSATRLSTGEKQRLALARATLMQAHIIFLDEPTSNLDPHSTDAVEILLNELTHSGTQLFVATHDLTFAKKYCQWVVYMEQGMIIEIARSTDFFEGPRSPEGKQFLERSLGWGHPFKPAV